MSTVFTDNTFPVTLLVHIEQFFYRLNTYSIWMHVTIAWRARPISLSPKDDAQ